MFAAPPIIETQVFARLPDSFRAARKKSAWVAARQHGEVHSFLEGPSFDRAGNLYVTDVAYGRIFKIAPDGTFHLVTEYDGEPNGLKIHKDGRIFIACHRRGLLNLDPATGAITPLVERANSEGFRGLNDLWFARNGDCYFTDQGQSGLQDPSGRVFRLRADGTLNCLMRNIPSPNGIVLNRAEDTVFLNVTRANAVWKLPLLPSGEITKAGIYLQLSGGSGPDGMAMDEQDNLVVAHAGFGTVWYFSKLGEPIGRIKSCADIGTTNVAYGGTDRKTLFITESKSGCVLMANMPVAGAVMYSHM